MLSHKSLLSMSSVLTIQKARWLAMTLGVNADTVSRIMDLEKPLVLSIFEILMSWRGDQPEEEMIDELVKALESMNENRLAEVVQRVGICKQNIEKEDLYLL